VFHDKLTMPLSEAWERSGFGNGVQSFDAFKHKVVDVLGVDGDNLTCLVREAVDLKYPDLSSNFEPTKNQEGNPIESSPPNQVSRIPAQQHNTPIVPSVSISFRPPQNMPYRAIVAHFLVLFRAGCLAWLSHIGLA